MYWVESNGVWELSVNNVTFTVKVVGRLAFVQATKQGQKPVPVFPEIWGHNITDVRIATLMKIKQLREGKPFDGTTQQI